MSISSLVERYPHVGIIASVTGFFGSLVSVLQAASVFIGLVGACFGLLAGFYTWRIKKRHWDKVDRDDRIQSDREDRAQRQADDATDRATRQANEATDRENRNQ